jgi:DNA-binding CsgD family transcriptional regulator
VDEAEQVSQLIGDIYDAALDPALWPHVLKLTCGYVGGAAASLQSHDSVRKSAVFQFTWGDDPYYSKLYNETYVKLNPAVTTAVVQTKIGEVCAYLDLIRQDEYRRSRFYRAWAAPQGYIDSVLVTLDKSATSFAAAVVMRHERHGLVDAMARRRMGLLAPHFCRAVAIGKVIDLHKVEAASLADALDGLASGMFLVDAHARIINANTSGHILLADGHLLRAQAGRLAANDVEADRTLQEAFVAASAGDAAVGTKGMAVALATDQGERWVAHVLPLTSGARRQAGMSHAAVAAVFVRKAALDLPSPLETIAALYKLTAAEMRVLMAIINVGGVPEVAPVLGISETTVKTHLQRVFEKTGTSRQADLVKLIAGYISPLGG